MWRGAWRASATTCGATCGRRRRVEYVKGLLDEVGLGGGRVEMFNMSASQGQRFAQCAQEMTERVRSLGPSPAKKTKEVVP